MPRRKAPHAMKGGTMNNSGETAMVTIPREKKPGIPRKPVLIAAAAMTVYGAMVAAPPFAHADETRMTAGATTSCPEIQVVFARGTGEPAGAGRVGETFADSLRSLVNGKSVAVYAVDYPASYDFLRAMDGVNDAAAFIQNTAASCPQTKMVLGGYSQGAAVVDVLAATGRPILGFTSPLPNAVADHVAAVVVFGNPSNRIGEPLTALSPLYGAKALDLCNGADPVCSDGDDRPAHSLYVEAGLVSQAAQFVADRVKTARTTQLAAGGN
jgi:cutinase